MKSQSLSMDSLIFSFFTVAKIFAKSLAVLSFGGEGTRVPYSDTNSSLNEISFSLSVSTKGDSINPFINPNNLLIRKLHIIIIIFVS